MDFLRSSLETGTDGYALCCFHFVTSQHPYFDSTVSKRLNCDGNLILKLILNSCNSHQIHLFFQFFHHSLSLSMSIFDQITSLFVLQIPSIVFFFSQLFLSDYQCSQTLPSQSITLILNVAFVNGFAALNHNHVCSFEVKNESISTDMSDNDTHTFCLT